MSREAASSSAPPLNGLARYHSAPEAFMASLNDGEGGFPHLHGASSPHACADAILTSWFSDDLGGWSQQNGAGGPVHMLHQFPILDEHNASMAGQIDPSKPPSAMARSRPGRLCNELASGSRQAGLCHFAALGYTNMICTEEFVSHQAPRNKWKVPTSSEGFIRASSLQQSNPPAQFFKYFSSGIQTLGEDQRKIASSRQTNPLPKLAARNLVEDFSETLDSAVIELKGCGRVDTDKCSALDNFSSVTGTSPPASKKRFRSRTSESSSSDILLDGEPQEQTCISLPKQELLPSHLTPCQSRAKRGHATHPRSIAERVRRTRISERIKKLQDLVPNMDKQINTADILDEVVDYVKFLQNQLQELSEDHSLVQG